MKLELTNLDLALVRGMSMENLDEAPLQSPAHLQALQDVVRTPCLGTWERAHGIILNREGMTLWQAVTDLFPEYAGIGKVTSMEGELVQPWGRIPTRPQLISAVEYATR